VQGVMKTALNITFLFVILLRVHLIQVLGQEPVWNKESPPKGVAWGGIYGIAQDPDGFIWLATSAGLHRYDGYRYVSYYHDPDKPNSLAYNRTETVFVSRNGKVWVGTVSKGLDRFDPITKTFTHFTHNPDDPGSLNDNNISSILEDRQGVIWVGTEKGLHRYHPETGKFTRYLHIPHDSTSLSYNQISSLFEDRQGRLWVGTGSYWVLDHDKGGLNLFHPENGTFTRYLHDPGNPNSLLNNKVRALYEDNQGTFWVGTLGDGLHTMDRNKGTFTRHQYDPKQPDKLSRSPIRGDKKDGITFIRQDATGVIWIGTLGSGISRFDPNTGKMLHSIISETKSNPPIPDNDVYWAHNLKEGVLMIGSLKGNLYRINPIWENFVYRKVGLSTHGIFEEAEGKIWVATIKGLKVYEQIDGGFPGAEIKIPLPNRLKTEMHSVILKDREGVIWIGGENGLWRRDPINHLFTLLTHDRMSPTSIGEGRVFAIHEDREGFIWVGTENGLNRMDPKTGFFTRFNHDPKDPNSLSNYFVSTIWEDKSGNLWVGTYAGLNKLNRKNGTFQHYLSRAQFISAIKEDVTGRLWVGSFVFGLYYYDPGKDDFFRYREKSTGEPIFTRVLGMVPDDQGNLWVSATAGLAKLDQEGNLAATYGEEAGLNPEIFSPLAICKGNKGQIFLGDFTGFFTFFPEKIKVNKVPPEIRLTDIRIFEKPANPKIWGTPGTPLSQAEKIELAHDQNTLTFDFAGIHYTNSSENRHFYLLENYDLDWRQAKTPPSVSYHQVPPGQYVFRIKAASSEGVWAEKGIAILIHPPWWRTWWAYGGYGLLFLTALLLARRETVRRERQRAGQRLQQLEAEKLREVDTLKSRFFSNVSHEFRTPLALIQGTAEKLTKEDRTFPERLPSYGLIHRSSERLLQLVNQLLDLSRLEAGKLSLQPEPGEVLNFVTLLASSFASLLEDKGLRYTYRVPQETLWVLFDKDKLEKILVNIISNAGKFTPSGGEVALEVEVERPNLAEVVLHITLSDTGEGIPAGLVERVFERFFQADSSLTRNHEGAGIGLALTKELVELHGGNIWVDSTPGLGSTFRVSLPLAVTEQPEESRPQENPELKKDQMPRPELRAKSFSNQAEDQVREKPAILDQPVVLVVEDNAELRHFIQENLPEEYAVLEAEDGLKGWEWALEVLPDLIISDVMMPRLDGMRLCQRLKADERTSHIAVILLTARADAESQLAGLEIGADDYLTKPFRLKELQLRVKNLLESRRRLRQRYSRSLTLQPAEVAVTSVDEKFLQKVLAVVEQHLADPDFDVEVFSRETGLSRVQLHRKLKALTDQSPGELIRTFRLRRAACLLARQHGNVSEVAFAVGFNSQAYFARCFREHYGQTPSEYAAQNNPNPARPPLQED
jgi:signal transduction histidine kinase/ligand-binding sensor domain-containing protein/DNA-binding response OmpR family regulator